MRDLLLRGAAAFAPVLLAIAAAPGGAATPPCAPCSGIDVPSPAAAVDALRGAPKLADEARLYVRWRHLLGESWDASAAAAIDAAGGTPWAELVFRTAAPVTQHAPELEQELEAAAAIAREGGPLVHFQVAWEPAAGAADPDQYAFLFKRASVAIAGARNDARVLPEALPPEPEAIAAFYAGEVAAYLDGLAVAPPAGVEALEAIASTVGGLDPGRPLIVDALPFPAEPVRAVAESARWAAAGASVTFFALAEPTPARLAPLVVLANETHGDLAFDPYSTPLGEGVEGWSFVRGEDLALRVVVAADAGGEPARFTFSDPQLLRPEQIDLATGEPGPLFGLSRSPEGLTVRIDDPAPVLLLGLERPTIAELEGVEEELTVATDRYLPVEEILRRMQAFEDAQARRLDHYSAVNTTHLRFQGGGTGALETTFEGPFFFRQGEGFDWAWQRFYLNGVRWRSDRLPEIPLIQPEKAATMPLTIELSPEYRYRLRGEGEIDGRAVWIVDFEPRDATRARERKLYQGTVWIDQEHYGRVRSRALQLGLEGEVISNEETLFYRPVDAAGVAAAWSPEAYWLPLRTVGQQLLNVLNNAVVVEREVLLGDVRINGADFEDARREVLASEVTMVRDTDEGLRYLVKEGEGGERVVKEGFDASKLFLAGGVFYDDSLDYPLPLAGVNWFSLDVKGTGAQANVFFGGALLVGDIATPSLFGSRFDAGADVFAIAVPFTDDLYREEEEVPEEAVEVRPASVEVRAGRPIGSFFRLGATYEASFFDFGRADDTAADFTVPENHVLHAFELDGRWSRNGYRLSLLGSWNRRSSWEPWGTPDQVAAFDPATEEFVRWEAQLAKTFHLSQFRKLGLELDYQSGTDLDRFSKYQFGFFGGSRIHGYQSGKVRAEEVLAAHLNYGFEVGEVFRLEGVLDAALANDEEEKLSDELLAGVGLVGQFLGPWQTLIQVDLGVPVAGPEDGFVAYLVFLKLFR